MTTALGIGRAVLVGHFAGAGMALEHPERGRGLAALSECGHLPREG